MTSAGSPPLVETEPPPRRDSLQRRNFTTDQAAAASRSLERGRWITDGRGFRSRSAAGWRAESLTRVLGDLGYPRSSLRRRTWIERRKWHWALQLAPGARRRNGKPPKG